MAAFALFCDWAPCMFTEQSHLAVCSREFQVAIGPLLTCARAAGHVVFRFLRSLVPPVIIRGGDSITEMTGWLIHAETVIQIFVWIVDLGFANSVGITDDEQAADLRRLTARINDVIRQMQLQSGRAEFVPDSHMYVPHICVPGASFAAFLQRHNIWTPLVHWRARERVIVHPGKRATIQFFPSRDARHFDINRGTYRFDISIDLFENAERFEGDGLW